MVDVLTEISPLAGMSRHGDAPGVRVREHRVSGAVSIAAREAGVEALSAALGWDLPRQPRCIAVEGGEVVWTGPGRWLLFSDRDRESEIRARAGAAGSVADQSDSRVVLRLEGPRLRDALAKGVSIDLHPRVFAIGHAAATLAAHIPALLWRPDEAGFMIALPRSFAAGFVAWLVDSALEFGLEVS